MDMSLVTSILALRRATLQMQVATTVLKSNMDAEKSAVQTLLGVAERLVARQSRPPASAAISTSRLTRRRLASVAAVISLIGVVGLAHSAGPAMLAISQPWPSTSTEVGIPSARPMLFRS